MSSGPPSDRTQPPESTPPWLDAALGAAADLLDRALILLRPDSRMVWCNRAGRALLDAPGSHGWLDREGRVRPRSASAVLAWRQALRAATAGSGDLDLGVLSASLPPGRLARLAASPDVHPGDSQLLLQPRAELRGAASLPTDPASAPVRLQSSSADATALPTMFADYARLFGLDATEARLLAPLAHRMPLSALALELHVSPSTLRRQVRGICLKAHLSGLPALRRELAALPPVAAARW